MKRFLFIVFTALSINAIAQTNTFPSSGNVGIGTTAPDEKLEVVGNLKISNGENCSIFPSGHSLTFGGRQEYAHVSYLFRPSWGTTGTTYSNFQLQNATNNGVFTTAVMFTTDGSNSFVNSGNIGIGTSSPQYKLDVSGNSRIGDLSSRHYLKVTSPEWPEIRFETPTSNEKIRIGVAHEDNSIYHVQEGDLYFFTMDICAMPFILKKTGNVLLNATSGNVGIGTTNPDQKLTVKGKIHAEEVIVDLNVPVADYVFHPTYKLMPLNLVEQYVKTNNHLPEIPSADEVSKNGMNMGEMQNKLLQKVEELTLYAIQQNKKIEDQEKKNSELEEELQTLKKIVANKIAGQNNFK